MKQKETNPSQKVRFSNSDPQMMRIHLEWLREICQISLKDIDFEIYIHETADMEGAKKYWSRILNLSLGKVLKS